MPQTTGRDVYRFLVDICWVSCGCVIANKRFKVSGYSNRYKRYSSEILILSTFFSLPQTFFFNMEPERKRQRTTKACVSQALFISYMQSIRALYYKSQRHESLFLLISTEYLICNSTCFFSLSYECQRKFAFLWRWQLVRERDIWIWKSIPQRQFVQERSHCLKKKIVYSAITWGD